MSGHNKWSKIKRQKEATDGKKSKEFGKFATLIAIAVKEARGNMDAVSVKTIVNKAKGVNMPKENIERALRKGAGLSSGTMEELSFECYGPGGVAVIARATTDNKNRTYPEVRHLLSQKGYVLAEPGSASWAFVKHADGTLEPTATVPLSEEDAVKLRELVAALESHEDIEEVVTNALS